jgi:predicted 3-demethylubiquinone-9 3-methyltransferase (glyoxalase superfamily)
MPTAVSTLLMFAGQAEEALGFYVELIPGSEIIEIARYGPGEPGPEGSVKHATARLAGTVVEAIDSPITQPFTFTPSISLTVVTDDRPELDALFTALSTGGQVLMPLAAYPFAPRFAWVTDRFGVSWQLTLRP